MNPTVKSYRHVGQSQLLWVTVSAVYKWRVCQWMTHQNYWDFIQVWTPCLPPWSQGGYKRPCAPLSPQLSLKCEQSIAVTGLELTSSQLFWRGNEANYSNFSSHRFGSLRSYTSFCVVVPENQSLVLSTSHFIWYKFIFPFCSSYIRSNDSLVLEKIQGILEQLPARIELPATIWTAEHQHLSSATSTHQSQLQLSPYWVLLSQEASHWNHIHSVVSGSLYCLLAAVKGKAAMQEDDENVYQALVTETVPKSWQVSISGIMLIVYCGNWLGKPYLPWDTISSIMQIDACFCSDVTNTSISKWLEYFSKRYEFLAKWTSVNSPAYQLDTKLPATFHLSALTLPKGIVCTFLLVVVQPRM